MDTNQMLIFVLVIFDFAKCLYTIRIDYNDKDFCLLNTTWIQNILKQNANYWNSSSQKCINKTFDKTEFDNLRLVDIKENRLNYKRINSCSLNTIELLKMLDNNLGKEYHLTKSCQRNKRQNNRERNPSEFVIPKEFVIEIVKYFQIKELLIVLDKTNLTGSAHNWPRLINEWKKTLSLYSNVYTEFVFLPSDREINIRRTQSRPGVFLLSDSSNSLDFIIKCAQQQWIDLEVVWFSRRKHLNSYLTWEENGSNFLHNRNATIGLDSNFYVFTYDGKDWESVQIEEFYGVDASPNLKRNFWGSWSNATGLNVTEEYQWERRKDLTGVTIKATTTNNPPITITKPLDDGQVNVSGAFGEIWRTLQSLTNFSYTMIPSVDGSWGSLQPDGTFGGMIGMILRDEVEVSVADYLMTESRFQVIDYSTGLVVQKFHMYLKTPSQDSSWTTYLQPFTTGMLIVTLFSILCCAVIISIPYYTAHWIKSNTKEEQQFSIGNSIIVTLGAFFQQGTNYDPQWTSTKIIFIVIFFTGLVVYTAYSASLTSALAVIKIKYPFKDLKTFYDQTNYKIGSVQNTAMDELFQTGNSFERKIFKERYQFVDSIEEGVQRMEAGNYVFLWAPDSMNYWIGNDCNFTSIKYIVSEGVVGFVMKKGSMYKPLFDYLLVNLIEKGQLYRIWKQWLIEPRTDCFDVDAGDLTLGMNNVVTAFISLMIAFGLTTLIFIAECVFKRYTRNKNIFSSSMPSNTIESKLYITKTNEKEKLDKTGPIHSHDMPSRTISAHKVY